MNDWWLLSRKRVDYDRFEIDVREACIRSREGKREKERMEKKESENNNKGMNFNTWKEILERSGHWRRPLASTSSWCKSTPPQATDIICQSICTDWFFYCLRLSKRPPRPDTLRNANSHRSNTFSTWLKFLEWENHYPDASVCACRARLDWFLFHPFLHSLRSSPTIVTAASNTFGGRGGRGGVLEKNFSDSWISSGIERQKVECCMHVFKF